MLTARRPTALHREDGGLARLPRAVTATLGAAMLRHAWTAVSTVGEPLTIGAVDWVALTLAELALLLVALHAPRMFQLRSFRLVGVAVSANAAVILFPLPEVIEIYDSSVPEAMVLSIAGGVLAMAVVFLLTARWSSAYADSRSGAFRISDATRSEQVVPIVIVLAALVVVPVWFAFAGLPPLFSLLTGSGADLAAERQASFSQLDEPVLRLAIGVVRNLLLMFAAGWFVANAVTTPREPWRQRSKAEAFGIATVGFGVFLAALTTERAILGELIVVCAVAYLVAKRRELSTLLVGILAAAALVFPVVVGVRGGSGGIAEVLGGLRERALFRPAEVMTRYFAEFPEVHEHLWGASVPKLSYLTGGETFDLSQHIYIRYYQRSEDVVGNANGSLFGVGWANFGAAGVVAWAILAAAALVVLDRWIDRLPTRSSAALRGVGVILAVLSTSADLFRSVLGFAPGFLDLLVVVGLVAWLDRRRTVPRRQPGSQLVS